MRTHERNDTEYWLDSADNFIYKERKRLLPKHWTKVEEERDVLAAELNLEEGGFSFTYKASQHEQLWLGKSLQAFYNDSLISDVLAVVKGGKEANVYCCQAHPNIGMEFAAAKVYRPRMLRNLKNDAAYREGRIFKDEDGKSVFDRRSRLALQKKTRYGVQLSIVSWIEYEFNTLNILYEAGVAVPRPVSQMENAILMEYIGEKDNPAPPLSDVKLERDEAAPLFQKLLMDVDTMLSLNCIHGDFSAYNILYWDGDVYIIDFPQVVDPYNNPSAHSMLLRDVTRLCQYFSKYGIRANPYALTDEMWRKHLRGMADFI
jgi:RIO kinase 1